MPGSTVASWTYFATMRSLGMTGVLRWHHTGCAGWLARAKYEPYGGESMLRGWPLMAKGDVAVWDCDGLSDAYRRLLRKLRHLVQVSAPGLLALPGYRPA